MKMMAAMAVAVLGLMVSVAGCKREKPLDGIGEWHFGKTTLEDWGYACQPSKNGKVWCQDNPLEKSHYVMLGEQNAAVGAQFASNDKSAPLEELELHVDACKADTLRSWLKYTFGDPDGQSETSVWWSKKLMFIAAKAPPKEITCKVNFVDAKNADRIAKLKAR